jgi:hypothetical protein
MNPWIGALHLSGARPPSCGSRRPANRPLRRKRRIFEQIALRGVDRGGVAKTPEGQREVGLAGGYSIEQFPHQRYVALAVCAKPQVPSQAAEIRGVEAMAEGGERV